MPEIPGFSLAARPNRAPFMPDNCPIFTHFAAISKLIQPESALEADRSRMLRRPAHRRDVNAAAGRACLADAAGLYGTMPRVSRQFAAQLALPNRSADRAALSAMISAPRAAPVLRRAAHCSAPYLTKSGANNPIHSTPHPSRFSAIIESPNTKGTQLESPQRTA